MGERFNASPFLLEDNEMKDVNGEIQYKDKKYKLVFNINVMEAIQAEFGSIEKWGSITDGSEGEPNVKAVIFGFMQMLNEGIEIENDENGTDIKPFTHKQVGRILSEVGMQSATDTMTKTVIDSTQSTEKNE